MKQETKVKGELLQDGVSELLIDVTKHRDQLLKQNNALLDSNRELLEALDRVTRVFIYSSRKEFETFEKVAATELAVHVLLKNGITEIGQTFEKK